MDGCTSAAEGGRGAGFRCLWSWLVSATPRDVQFEIPNTILAMRAFSSGGFALHIKGGNKKFSKVNETDDLIL